jgi:type VI secretion system secreted protein VgrG
MVAALPTLDDRDTLALSAGPYPAAAFEVLSVIGQEGVSSLSAFQVTVAASFVVPDDTIEAELLGAPACLTMCTSLSPARFVRGVVSEVRALSADREGHIVYALRLVPALWLLTQRTDSRVFQDKTVLEIVAAVLQDNKIPFALRVLGKYRERAYCVQYRETDFAFVERLLAEEGFFYTIEPGGAGAEAETVVIADNASLYPTIPGDFELLFRPRDDASKRSLGDQEVVKLALQKSICRTSVFRRGFDFTRPNVALLASAAANELGRGAPERRTSYEHHEEDEEPNVRDEAAASELEQHRTKSVVGEGESGCRRLAPGARFKLKHHDLNRLDQEYVVTEVKHRAERAQDGSAGYSNTFVCVPSSVVIRPLRRERFIQQVTETAIVVGPNGQEIHADEYGRVKVQFHWDREGRSDDHSSCWLRVAQAWAGSGWGSQFIPRVGMEVVVTFLGGDTDRPLITGCVYNGANRPPFPLPAAKAKSGFVSRTSPNGGGGNEVSFDDERGKEKLIFSAQRDLIQSSAKDLEINVGNDVHERVRRHAVEEVLANKTVEVGGKLSEEVHGDRNSACDGNLLLTVGGGLTHTIQGNANLAIHQDGVLHVDGNTDVVVGVPGKEHHATSFVYGDQVLGVSDTLRLRAEKGIILECGESSVEITPAGVRIRAKKLDLGASESASMTGAGPSLRLNKEAELVADTLRLFSSKASLVLDKEAKLKGELIKLNCSDDTVSAESDEIVSDEKKPFKLKLSDAEYGVYANKTYHVLVDGARYEGTTDGDGLVDQQIPKYAKAVTVRLWTDAYPTGPQKTWTIKMDELASADSPRGAQQRLANMGYFSGDPKDALDDATRAALRDFQAHVGLPTTGELDTATVAKLGALHGK